MFVRSRFAIPLPRQSLDCALCLFLSNLNERQPVLRSLQGLQLEPKRTQKDVLLCLLHIVQTDTPLGC